MTSALGYEGFIRFAFSLNGQDVDRSGDPANMANADSLQYGNFNSVKATVAYGITAVNSAILNSQASTPEVVRKKLQDYVDASLSAQSPAEIINIIADYRAGIVDPNRTLIEEYKASKKRS